MIFDLFNSNRVAMSNVDTAWLRMERPTNLMMITGVIVLEGKVDYGKLKRTVRDRFLSYSRFSDRPVERTTGTYWEPDPNFDIESHIHRVALPGAAGKSELQQYVSDLASTALDQTKPMWQFHLIDNYADGDAIVVRIHHCYADGIALVQVLLSMTDDSSSPPPRPRRRRSRFTSGAEDASALQRLYEPASKRVGSLLSLGSKAWQEGKRILNEPSHAKTYVDNGVEIASELGRAILLGNDSETRFKGRLGVQKRVAWADPIPLNEVKTIARGLGCTVNDVLVSSVTGAMRAYLFQRGDPVDGLCIRATVPVNLRPLEHAQKLGNHFGLVFLDLPVGIANPLDRVYAVKRSMDELKSSKQAVATFGFLELLGLAPHLVQQPTLDVLSRKASVVLTNVPGPQKPLYLAGLKILEQMFWVPQSGEIGIGASILSYNGNVYFGLLADKNLVRDPQAIVERFKTDFENLVLATMMEPWGESGIDDHGESQPAVATESH